MPNWIDPIPVDVPASFSELNLPPLIAQTLVRRGFNTAEEATAFLDPDSLDPTSPFELPGMEAAVERIELAIRKKQRVCIWGDFDVDGQTSTALLVQTLRCLGADVSYHIPIRSVSSHGVHIPELAEIIDRGANLILTCDTGITAHEAVDYAKSRGVDFVITDHHDLGASLPDAIAVVDPKMLAENHALANLAGVGVAYKLAEALFLNGSRWTADRPLSTVNDLHADDLLDLVALGLIADVAILRGETRMLAQKGLDVLRNSDRLGLQLMAELANQPLTQATEAYVGFVIGPRLNALGRLGDANPVVELLTTNDPVRARVLAAQLEGLNSQRKLLTSQVYRAAKAQLGDDPSLLESPVIVLGHSSWPGGIVGIVASRLKERYNKPVILFNTVEGEPARGSARSIEGLHITEAIASHSDLLIGFGGHPMAAGMSLDQDNLPAFRKGLGKTVAKMLGDAAYEEPSMQIDAWLKLDELSLELAKTIEKLAPFGAGNPALTFASRGVHLKAVSKIGKTKDHLRLNVEADETTHGILWWNGADEDLPETGVKMDIAYSIRASTYRGEPQLTLEFKDLRIVEEKAAPVRKSSIEVIDLRKNIDRYPKTNVQIFAEGEAKKELNAVDRNQLERADELIIYTTPPGPAELRAILEQVEPKKVYLIAQNPPAEKTDDFLTRMAGMAKFVVRHKEGKTTISELAAAVAQRGATVRIGLEWLAAGGHVAASIEEDAVALSAGEGEKNQYLQKELYVAVKGLLDETVAYRLHIRSAKPHAIIY